MSMHLRRLRADQAAVTAAFASHPSIRLLETSGEPADRYVIALRVSGLVPRPDGVPMEAGEHKAEIFLPADYPRRPPFCRMLTPVFHPNIDPQKICIGDHWSAGQTLTHLMAQIGEMLCFQSYNVKSPLNAEAAVWAQANEGRLPLQRIDLRAGC